MEGSGLETRLVLRAQAGDREAADRVFQALQGPLLGYLRRLTGDPALAEDLLQDVFVLIYRKLTWLRDPSLLRPWAYRIASREALRRLQREHSLRAQERDPELLAQVAAVPVEDPGPELRARLDELVASVSPASRAVVVLHYLEEKTLQEVADVLGIRSGTVKSRLAYGLAAMRRAAAARPPVGSDGGGGG